MRTLSMRNYLILKLTTIFSAIWMYGTMYGEDKLWYRCKVMPNNQPSWKYIDFSNVAEVEFQSMVELPKSLENNLLLATKSVVSSYEPANSEKCCHKFTMKSRKRWLSKQMKYCNIVLKEIFAKKHAAVPHYHLLQKLIWYLNSNLYTTGTASTPPVLAATKKEIKIESSSPPINSTDGYLPLPTSSTNASGLTPAKVTPKAKIEDLLNDLTKVESEKENEVNKLTQENKNLARRINTLKDSSKQKSERIQSLLKEINDQKKSYDDDTQSFKDSMEEKFQRLKERDCLKKDRMVNLLKCDVESKEKEILKLQRELKEFKKIAADSKEWVHRNALYKLRLSQHSKRLEIYKKILSRTSGENKKLKQEFKALLETENESEDVNTYTKILQQEVIAELEEQRADSLDAEVKKLEKFLHLEEEKNAGFQTKLDLLCSLSPPRHDEVMINSGDVSASLSMLNVFQAMKVKINLSNTTSNHFRQEVGKGFQFES